MKMCRRVCIHHTPTDSLTYSKIEVCSLACSHARTQAQAHGYGHGHGHANTVHATHTHTRARAHTHTCPAVLLSSLSSARPPSSASKTRRYDPREIAGKGSEHVNEHVNGRQEQRQGGVGGRGQGLKQNEVQPLGPRNTMGQGMSPPDM